MTSSSLEVGMHAPVSCPAIFMCNPFMAEFESFVHMHNTLTHTWHAAILFVVIPTYRIVEILSTIIMYHNCCLYFTVHEIHLFTCVDSSSPVTTTPVQASESSVAVVGSLEPSKKLLFYQINIFRIEFQ